MPSAAPRLESGGNLITMAREAVAAIEALLDDATRKLRARLIIQGKVSSQVFDTEQRAAHGLAWFATYVEAIRQLVAYADRLKAAKRFGEIEELLVRIGIGEYLAQMSGGIAMSQGEIVRTADFGLNAADVAMQTLGGMGYACEYNVERYWKEARLMRIAPISQEMVLNYVAEHVLGLPRSY